MIANLPGAAPLHGHESRFLIVMMEAIHGSVLLVLAATSIA
jgi:hypothetical protein